MRLWHYKLLPYLPNNQLKGQNRECCALRGLGWGKKHSTVNYVFKYSKLKLVNYHFEVMKEIIKRREAGQLNFTFDLNWFIASYRGKKIGFDDSIFLESCSDSLSRYPEHNDEYLKECLDNLEKKGIKIFIKE